MRSEKAPARAPRHVLAAIRAPLWWLLAIAASGCSLIIENQLAGKSSSTSGGDGSVGSSAGGASASTTTSGTTASGVETVSTGASSATASGSGATASSTSGSGGGASTASSTSGSGGGSSTASSGAGGNLCDAGVPADCDCPSGPCTLANATTACVMDECAILSCNTHFGNCNKLRGDGCESDFTTDSRNCGGCDMACDAGLTCKKGICK